MKSSIIQIGFSFLFLALTIMSCEKDSEFFNDSSNDFEIITITEKGNYNLLISNANNLPQIVKRIEKYDTTKVLKWSKEEASSYWINPDQVVATVDSLGNKTYAFELKSKRYEPDHLYNLIVATRVDNKKVHPFIMDYQFINSNKYAYAREEKREFKGTINVYSYQNFISSVGNLSARDTLNATPCYEDMGRTVSDSSDSGDGSSGGTGGDGGGLGNGTTGGSSTWAPVPPPSTTTITVKNKTVGYVEVGEGDYVNALTEDFKGESSTESTTTTVDEDCPNDVALLLPINEEEDRIITNELIEREKCIFEMLTKNSDDFIKELLNNFEGESEFDVQLISRDGVFNGDSEVNAKTSPPIDGLIIIEFNSNLLYKYGVLYVARTFLHEFIHAKMNFTLYSTNPNITDLNFLETYTNYEKKYIRSYDAQHQTMAELYVNSMASALKKFHRSALLDEYNFLHESENFNDSFYESLAWRGLQNQNVEAYNQLEKSKKEALNKLYEKFLPELTKNCSYE